jgi:hypothetical protein
MPPRDPIRTYVPEQHQQKAGPVRERGDYVERHKIPTLIRWFIWLLIFRCVVNIVFGLTIGLAPDSDTAAFITTHFDPWPKTVSAEGVFYVTAVIYGVMAWRWASRDWRVRWGVMFASGATAAKMLINYAANQAAAGSPTPLTISEQAPFFVSVVLNVLICLYMAFYPGMEQAFKETPWD